MTHSHKDIKKCFVRALSGTDGATILSHLRKMTIEKVLGPNASDADLRWDAAQRSLVRYIEQMTYPNVNDGGGKHE